MTQMGRFGILVALLAFSLYFSPSSAANSYLQALHRPAPHPIIYRPQRSHIQRNEYQNNGYNSNRKQGDRNGCSTNYKVDYLLLSLQWGPGFCATSPQDCKRSENRLFSIHGMWPQSRNSAPPSFCCFDNEFVYNEIEPLVPSLNKYWFSFYDKNSRGFWSHEWLKHGTCFRDVKPLQGELAFFSKTLDLVKKLPVLETLAKNGIVPGDNKVYNSREIENVLRQLTGGKSTRVDCDLEAHQPIPLLKGVDICFDTSLNFVDCPPSKSRCQRQVYFLK